ncbi:CBS domain-containing membrane protein [Gammaproteobacteria bacterium]
MLKKIEINEIDLTESEIEDAMKEVGGFIDITPDDFSKIYHIAYRKAAFKALAPYKKEEHEISEKKRTGILKILRPISEPAPRVSYKDIFWSWLSSLCGIGLVAWLNNIIFSPRDLILIIGSFGASAVLIYGAIKSPLAQPRNFIGGHLVSSLVGVASWMMFSSIPWFAAAFAVATAISVMHLTRTVHPPGGATALIAVIGGESIQKLGFMYTLMPVMSGALIMLVVALIFNNTVKWRKYPEFWF